MILLGYHSMAGTPDGLLAHTMSPAVWKRFSVNGITLGEIGMMALIAGSHGVPVWLVTGGRCACEEAAALLGPELPTLAVKEDIAHESSITVAPTAARRMIRKAVAEVVAGPPAVRPFMIERPWRASLELASRELGRRTGDPVEPADRRRHLRGVDRLHRRPDAALLGHRAAGRAELNDRGGFRISTGDRR